MPRISNHFEYAKSLAGRALPASPVGVMVGCLCNQHIQSHTPRGQQFGGVSQGKCVSDTVDFWALMLFSLFLRSE